MSRVYYHCGQMGDIIYSLPTVRTIGPGKFVTALNWMRHHTLAPLLELQSCITEVEHFEGGRPLDFLHVPPGTTHDLNLMRMPEYFPLHVRTLVQSHALPFGVSVDYKPWLDAGEGWERGKYDRAVVNRSFRYRRPDINWREEIGTLYTMHRDVVFVGMQAEYEDFCNTAGDILPWKYCSDSLVLAQFIYESRQFSGNQSFPLSLAVGYGIPHHIERAPGHTNCNFPDTVEIK